MTARPLAPASVEAPATPRHRWAFGFTPRVFLLLAVGFLALVPAWIDRRAAYGVVAWDCLVFAFWIVDASRLPAPSALRLRRSWPDALTIGRPASVEVGLTNDSGAVVHAWLADSMPGALRRELPELELVVPGGAAESGRYVVMPSERGDLQVGRLFARYRSAVGLAERWAVAPIEQSARVYPDLHDARQQSMYLVRSRQVAIERRRARAPGLGRDFESLRDYRQGDELRDVCWTATARRAKIVTKVYQPERSQAVWIIVDGGRLLRARVDPGVRPGSDRGQTGVRPAGQTKLDCLVNAALALAQVALAAGDRVALVTYGRRIHQRLAPDRGPQHLRAMVEALATVAGQSVEADHARAAGAVLASQKQRALVVWLTDVAETAGVPDVIESASRLSPRHAVVFAVMAQPEMTAVAAARPTTFADQYRTLAAQETLERREGLLRGLRQRGVLALELSPRDLTPSLVNQYLEVKGRNLV